EFIHHIPECLFTTYSFFKMASFDNLSLNLSFYCLCKLSIRGFKAFLDLLAIMPNTRPPDTSFV
ncbi:MAG: hypothetical protein QGI15_03865, partial [Candidatus Scalindua sp.]|nr:hypothetical protein [Candidatus Scalindua sp.]